jgi:hypothetical protein
VEGSGGRSGDGLTGGPMRDALPDGPRPRRGRNSDLEEEAPLRRSRILEQQEKQPEDPPIVDGPVNLTVVYSDDKDDKDDNDNEEHPSATSTSTEPVSSSSSAAAAAIAGGTIVAAIPPLLVALNAVHRLLV